MATFQKANPFSFNYPCFKPIGRKTGGTMTWSSPDQEWLVSLFKPVNHAGVGWGEKEARWGWAGGLNVLFQIYLIGTCRKQTGFWVARPIPPCSINHAGMDCGEK